MSYTIDLELFKPCATAHFLDECLLSLFSRADDLRTNASHWLFKLTLCRFPGYSCLSDNEITDQESYAVHMPPARVVESKNPEYKVGKYIVGSFGWRTKTIVNPSVADSLFNSKIYILPDLGGLSESLGVGVLGMPGQHNYCHFCPAQHSHRECPVLLASRTTDRPHNLARETEPGDETVAKLIPDPAGHT
uniref:Uncharacterized protein n=1 Tax=Timema douglasi TaxID=61478 RepID=A0A7R8Z9L4_TIMDO|nr:unnamed protein product [Timema douglasi]